MAFALNPAASVAHEVTRTARDRVDTALRILAELDDDPASIERGVHRTRKRCKEARATARLVRSALGDGFGTFNASVRDAAQELGTIRDAHATLATFHILLQRHGEQADADLLAVRSALANIADTATRSVGRSDPRLEVARTRLEGARQEIEQWRIPDDFDVLADGLRDTFRRGRTALERSRRTPTDERIHEWRKATKTLWYQTRLIERSAPSVWSPSIATLDALANALGDDHDLAVLVERLAEDPDRFGGASPVDRAVALARAEQDELRRRAFRLGETVFAERPRAFARRATAYWAATVADGVELVTGGISDLPELGPSEEPPSTTPSQDVPPVGDERHEAADTAANTVIDAPTDTASVVERERKFLVAVLPVLADGGVRLRQGYVAIDDGVSVRVRESGDDVCTLTLKAGGGAVRTELEWEIAAEEFAAAWELTGHRRIDKTRYRLPLGDHVAEVDVFHGDLEGLVVVEVEFGDDEAMASFEPPDWFGREVTDDPSYTNASLAVEGHP